MKKITILALVVFAAILYSCNDNSNHQATSNYHLDSDVPNLVMPSNKLKFKEIKDYKNYKIIGTHFRTDKNEIRYILANEIAFKATSENALFPEGSIIVKIGWKAEKMSNFPTALEAKEVQRIEYMIKDSKNFANNPGNWGYARFTKENGKYKSWENGSASCIACHNLASQTQFVFTKYQKLQ